MKWGWLRRLVDRICEMCKIRDDKLKIWCLLCFYVYYTMECCVVCVYMLCCLCVHVTKLLPQGLTKWFSRIWNVGTKTWYKKHNSVLEYYASRSHDVTSADSDNNNNNNNNTRTTKEDYVDSRHRQDILPFSKASRRSCDTHWTYYTIQRVAVQTDGFIFFKFADGLQSLK